jgi:hypothetical protein
MLRCGFLMFCAFLQGVVLYTEECATLTSKGPRPWMFGKALLSGNPLACVFVPSVVCMWYSCVCTLYCCVCTCQLCADAYITWCCMLLQHTHMWSVLIAVAHAAVVYQHHAVVHAGMHSGNCQLELCSGSQLRHK